MEKKKIIIIGSGESGKATAQALNKTYPDEAILMTPEEAREQGIEVIDTFKIEARPDLIMDIPQFFTPPKTRAERRKEKRNKTKSSNN